MSKDFQRQLNQPFESHEIEWRINRKGFSNGKPWATAIPYITSRAVQDRLDSVFGLFGWQNETKMVTDKGFLSGISIKHDGEWITKWDGAEGSNSNGMDLIKSGSSNALKRAAVLLGIGRYLYDLDEFFVESILSEGWKHPYGNVYKDSKNQNKLVAWRTPNLPLWSLPGFDIDLYISDMKKAKSNNELDEAYYLAQKAAKLHDNKNMLTMANKVGKEKRLALKAKLALNIAQDTKEITLWADSQIKAFAMVPNAASVESLYEALILDLSVRIKETAVEIVPIKNKITEEYNSRIRQLEAKEE